MFQTTFPLLFASEEDKDASVAAKLIGPWNASLRRPLLGGAEAVQGGLRRFKEGFECFARHSLLKSIT